MKEKKTYGKMSVIFKITPFRRRQIKVFKSEENDLL